MFIFPASGGGTVGYTDANANTPWYALIPGLPGAITRFIKAQVDNGATDNGLYVMRPIGLLNDTDRAFVTTARITSDTTVPLDRDPSAPGNTIASGDQVVIQCSDGVYRQFQVSSWSANTVTLTGALGFAVDSGAPFFFFGVFNDTDPRTGVAFPKLDTKASVVTDIPTTGSFEAGFPGFRAGDPILLYSPNATNKTKLNFAEYVYTPF